MQCWLSVCGGRGDLRNSDLSGQAMSAGSLRAFRLAVKVEPAVVFPRAKGRGVNQTKMAIYTSDGYVSSSTIAGKFLACAISIGSGNSLGPEDPSLQMGAGVASRLGRMFHLPRSSMRLIAPVGAAAGIAAAFNTPITGVLFVMEEVLADWSVTALGSIVLAAVPWNFLLFIGLAKILVTLMCSIAETPGGMFAPALFIGAMIGGAFGGLTHRFFPTSAAPGEAYMLVGMGTFFVGVFRSPITSIFMVFELSASYVIVLPVMIANTASYLISRRLHEVPFFKMLAQLEGVNLPSAEEKRNFQPLRVENAMQRATGPIAPEPGMRLYPDEPLDAALRLLSSLQPRVQVISRLRPDEVLGTLTLEDVHRAYGIGE